MNQERAVPGSIRTADLLGLSASALRQQKVRTLLTLAGVVIGTFTLIVSLAVGQGVDRAIVALFQEDDRIRKIEIYPKYEPAISDIPAAEREPKGAMSDAKRRRLRKAIIDDWDRTHRSTQKQPLTSARIEELSHLDHVESAEPMVYLWTKAAFQGKTERVSAVSAGKKARLLQDRLVAGSLLYSAAPRGAIVGEFLLYRWGITAEDDVAAAIGRRFRLESPDAEAGAIPTVSMIATSRLSLGKDEAAALERALRRLVVLVRFLPMKRDERDALIKLLEGPADAPKDRSPAPFSEEFTIIGAVREWADNDPKPPPNNWGIRDADIYLPTQAAAAFHLRTAQGARDGFGQVELTVDQVAHVKELAKQVEGMGYTQYSFAEFIGTVRMNVLMVTFATAFVAVVALLVAALGITNTMIMSVLERTHEIGIMKALGARTGHLRLIFLVEGAVLGLAGGLIGLALAFLVSYPGDAIAKSIMEPQTQTPVKGSLFVYSLWLVLGAPALAALITTLAAVYPAHRAASVDPITSLRHE
jgi:putative ABC transport system permease protein